MNSRLIEFLDRLLSLWVIILTGSMSVIVIISVILRYVFSIGFIWSEELVTMLFMGFSFFGCVSAVKEKEHIGIDFVIRSFPPGINKIFKLIVSIISIIVLAVVIKAAVLWISTTGSTKSPGLRVPLSVFYSMLPVNFALMILYELMSIKDNMFSRRKGVDGK